MNTLLITGCIDVSNNIKYLKIKNKNDRLNQYLETIRWAIEETNFNNIIFCENSNYEYDFDSYVSKLKNINKKNFEYLTFKGDTKNTDKHGKGYGEGEIVKYAYNNSRFLKDSDYFYKLTGRLKIKNINKILNLSKSKNYFLNGFDHTLVDTRFYKLKTDDYQKYFINNYKEVDDDNHKPLEVIYKKTLDNNNIKYFAFIIYPVYNGISGSTGVIYDTKGIKKIIGDFLCLTRLHNSKFIKNIFKLIKKK